jgi:anti-sigma regulatory factor (Ser/Thr protein kinase)/membrane protein implicated in regulation of membrane protease activity
MKSRTAALRLALTYAAGAAAWIVTSDLVSEAVQPPGWLFPVVNISKGLLFVAVTSTLLYMYARRFLSYAEESHNRYRMVQEQLRDRDRAIQQAYVDVLASVTGGKLFLMWPDDVPDHLGDIVLPDRAIAAPEQLSEARERLKVALAELPHDADKALLAANEGITNALKHAGGGHYGVRRTRGALQVVITDHGPGIDFQTLPKATLIAGYSTKASLGLGFTIMFDAAERILLATDRGLTTLVLEFPLAA